MAPADREDHFSWEDVYSLNGVHCEDEPVPLGHIPLIEDDQSSPGETGRISTPLSTPIEAFSD